MDLMIIIPASMIIGLASFFATVSGFGYALVATPLLSLVMPVKEAIILVIITTVALRSVTMYYSRKEIEWHTVIMTTLGTFFGMVPGSFILHIFKINELEVFLGLVLLGATLLMSMQYKIAITNQTLGRLGAGFFSGFFGASTSVSGPPLVLYFINEKTNKDIMRANMIWIFGISGFFTVIANYCAGNINSINDWPLFVGVLPGMAIGIWAGQKMFYKLNQHLFRRLSLSIVLVGAVMMLVNGLRTW